MVGLLHVGAGERRFFYRSILARRRNVTLNGRSSLGPSASVKRKIFPSGRILPNDDGKRERRRQLEGGEEGCVLFAQKGYSSSSSSSSLGHRSFLRSQPAPVPQFWLQHFSVPRSSGKYGWIMLSWSPSVRSRPPPYIHYPLFDATFALWQVWTD